MQFLKDINERRRFFHPGGHGKGKPHRLPLFVVRILPQNNRLYVLERRLFHGVENIEHRGVNRARGIFPFKKLAEAKITFGSELFL